MDMNAYADAAVLGIPLVLVVLGFVAWLGKLGVSGNWKLVSALVIGLIFGAGYQLSQSIPATFGGWFGVVVYGLGLGLVASGIYEVAKVVAQKGFEEAMSYYEINEPEG